MKSKAQKEDRKRMQEHIHKCKPLEQERFMRSGIWPVCAYTEPVTGEQKPTQASHEQMMSGKSYALVKLKLSILAHNDKPYSSSWRIFVGGFDLEGYSRHFEGYAEAKAFYDSLSEPLLLEDLVEFERTN